MRILIISNMYPSIKDPTFGTFVKVFDDGLKRLRPEIKIDRAVYRGRTKYKTIKLFKYLKLYLTIIIRLLFINYDYVYVHTITYPTPALRFVNLFKNINLIFNVHGVDVLTRSKLSEWLKNLCRPLLSKCLFLVVPSSYFKDVVNKELPEVNDKKIIISASGGVEKQFFQRINPKDSLDFKIGYVSRITKGKGWDTYLSSLRILKEQGITFTASIVGTGDEVDELSNTLSEYNLGEQAKYLGPLEHTKLSEYYKNLDVLVFPSESESESLGLVGLEAMASSVPVIGSDIGGISTYVIDNNNGFLFKPGDSIELADRLKFYKTLTTEEKKKLRKNAYNTALEYETSFVLQALFNKIFTK